jgi:hypothetical protein
MVHAAVRLSDGMERLSMSIASQVQPCRKQRTTILQMLRAGDVRAGGYPQFGHDTILAARSTVKPLVAFGCRVHIRYRSLADAAAEYNLFNGNIIVLRRWV